MSSGHAHGSISPHMSCKMESFTFNQDMGAITMFLAYIMGIGSFTMLHKVNPGYLLLCTKVIF